MHQQVSMANSANHKLRQEIEKYKTEIKKLGGKLEGGVAISTSDDFMANGKAVDYKALFEEQQEELAEWMVSQKAFKELAIQFGLEKGQTAEVTIEQGFAKKIDVLEDKHNPQHNTIAGNASKIRPFRDKLIAKIKNSA